MLHESAAFDGEEGLGVAPVVEEHGKDDVGEVVAHAEGENDHVRLQGQALPLETDQLLAGVVALDGEIRDLDLVAPRAQDRGERLVVAHLEAECDGIAEEDDP